MRGFVERVEAATDGRTGWAGGGTEPRPTLPVFTDAQQAGVLAVMDPVLRLYGETIREAYALGQAVMAPRVPKRLHAQLAPFLGGFADDAKGYLLRYLLDEGLAPLPVGPGNNTLGMYVRYGTRG